MLNGLYTETVRLRRSESVKKRPAMAVAGRPLARSAASLLLPTVLDSAASPLIRDPLTTDQASSLAGVFTPLSDPVRLRLLAPAAESEPAGSLP